VDPLDVVGWTRALVDIDSTTGREGRAGEWLARELAGLSWQVTQQPVAEGRFNLYASSGTPPTVVFSTHFDCVPPFFPSRIEGGRLYGRGACDAKGILAAQVAAATRLRAEGVDDVALLFVVGEERGSDGAAVANRLSPSPRYLVNGEPTDSRLATATRGALRVRLSAAGRAAHSSNPELGQSAIEKLVDALVALRTLDLPADPVLGRTHYTVGLISGGLAPNVVPPAATAEVMFRTVGPSADVLGRLAPIRRWVDDEVVLDIPAVRMVTVPGFDTAVFSFATDVPQLDAWGEPLLFGPGSIQVAHTDHEYVEITELEAAVGAYVRLARSLCGRGSRGAKAPRATNAG
jgi:acetylornithine deacetylase